MNKIFLLIIIILVLAPTFTTGDDIIDEILENFKQAERSFNQYIELIEVEIFKNDVSEHRATFLLAYSLAESIAVQKKPEIDKGKIYLCNDDGYFYYFPKPQRYIRISARSQLYGNFKTGDLLKPPTLKYYDFSGYEYEQNNQGDLIYILRFTAKPNIQGVSIFNKVVSFNYTRQRIEKIQSFSRSGVLLGQSLYLEFDEVEGKKTSTLIKIIDVKNPGSYTLMKTLFISPVVLPSNIFSAPFLKYAERKLEQISKQ